VLSTDTNGVTDSDAVAITVNAVGDGPLNTVPGAQTVNEDTVLSIGGVSVSDADGNLATTQLAVTNGTLNAQYTLPRQMVRLRLLNAEIQRDYNIGFNDGRTFYVIATDGGLLSAPVPVKNLIMAPAERYVAALKVLLDAPDVDALLFIQSPTAIVPSEEIASACASLIAGSRRSVFACWLGGDSMKRAEAIFVAAGIPTYATPEEAVRGFLQLAGYRHRQELLMQTPPSVAGEFAPDVAAARDTDGASMVAEVWGEVHAAAAQAVATRRDVVVKRFIARLNRFRGDAGGAGRRFGPAPNCVR
jgi:hypothetical protein